MTKTLFPVDLEFDVNLPFYIGGIGYSYEQEYIHRPNGFPYYQWIQCRSGGGELKVNNNTYSIGENQGMFLLPDVPHEYYATKGPWVVDWIIFRGSAIRSFFEETAKLKTSGMYYISHPHTIAEKLRQIYDYEMLDSPMKSIESSRLSYAILLDLLKFTSEKMNSSYSYKYNRLKPIFNYINENYNKSITLDDLSKLAGITPQHLCSSFKNVTSHTITEYINLTRIKKSKELMSQKHDMQVKEIARLVGFNDVSYFCSIFRKYVNMSPVEFKNIL